MREPDPGLCQRVQVGRVAALGPVAPDAVGAQRVDRDQKNAIGAGFPRRRAGGERSEAEGSRNGEICMEAANSGCISPGKTGRRNVE